MAAHGKVGPVLAEYRRRRRRRGRVVPGTYLLDGAGKPTPLTRAAHQRRLRRKEKDAVHDVPYRTNPEGAEP